VVLDGAPGCRTDNSVVACNVARDTSDSSALQASFGAGKRGSSESGNSNSDGE